MVAIRHSSSGTVTLSVQHERPSHSSRSNSLCRARNPLRRDSVRRRRRDRRRVHGDACADWGPLPARRPFRPRSRNLARQLEVGERSNARGETAGRGGADHPSGRRRIGSDRPNGHHRDGRRRVIVLVWAHVRATRREAAR